MGNLNIHVRCIFISVGVKYLPFRHGICRPEENIAGSPIVSSRLSMIMLRFVRNLLPFGKSRADTGQSAHDHRLRYSHLAEKHLSLSTSKIVVRHCCPVRRGRVIHLLFTVQFKDGHLIYSFVPSG